MQWGEIQLELISKTEITDDLEDIIWGLWTTHCSLYHKETKVYLCFEIIKESMKSFIQAVQKTLKPFNIKIGKINFIETD